MKKTKLIALTMIIAIMMIGAGYAAWTDFTQIDTTIATGTMDVKIYGSYIQNELPNAISEIKDDKDNMVTFNVKNLYPTNYKNGDKNTYGAFEVRAENTGSLPVKLKSVELINKTGSEKVWKDIKVVAHVFFNGKNITSSSPSYGSHNKITIEEFIELLNKDIVEKEIKLSLKDKHNVGTMQFGSIRYYLDAASTGNETQGENIGFTIKFNWEQAN